MKRICSLICGLWFLLIFFGCSGGGSSANNPGNGNLDVHITFTNQQSGSARVLQQVNGISNLQLILLPLNPGSFIPSPVDLMPVYQSSSNNLTINNLTDNETYYVKIEARDAGNNVTYYGSNSVVIQPNTTNAVSINAVATNDAYQSSQPTFTATALTVNVITGQPVTDLSLSGGGIGISNAFVYSASNTGNFTVVSTGTDNGILVNFSNPQSLRNDGLHYDGTASDNLFNLRISNTAPNIGDTFRAVVVYTNVFSQPDMTYLNTSVITAPSSLKAITAYSFVGFTGFPGTVNETAKTIAVTLPFGTDVTNLVATFTTTGTSVQVGTAVQTSSATANNFTSPVAYTVTAADNSTTTYTVTTTLTVPTATLSSIAVTPATITVQIGGTHSFVAMGTYSDGTTVDISNTVAWTSGSPVVATVLSTTGVATGMSAGTATITATSGGHSGSASLTVTPATLMSIAITPTTSSIFPGGTQQFTATGLYSDGSTQDLTTSVTWSSSNISVAIITNGNAAGPSGLATAATFGITTITATLPGLSSSTTMTVM